MAPPGLPLQTVILFSYGRRRIHKNLISIVEAGGTPFAVDCDSLSYTLATGTPTPLPHSMLFGDFKQVYQGQLIKSFCSTSNKNYCITTELPDGQIKQTLRMKGISLKNTDNFQKVSEAYTGDPIISYQLFRAINYVIFIRHGGQPSRRFF